jgi:hypothetical protein
MVDIQLVVVWATSLAHTRRSRVMDKAKPIKLDSGT